MTWLGKIIPPTPSPPPAKKGNLLIKKISKTPAPSPFLPKTMCLCQGQPGKTQWATVGCLRTAGWGRLQCMRCYSQGEWGEHPAGKRRVSGWGTRVQAGLRGVSHREEGAALYRVSEPMWSKEGTHAGRWPGAGCGSSRGVRRKNSPAKRTEICLGWEECTKRDWE